MVGGRQLGFYSEEVVQFFHEGRGELWAVIRDDFFGETVEFPDIVSELSGEANSRSFGVRGNEMSAFGESVIYNEDGVVSTA